MILVDTSIWIDLLSKNPSYQVPTEYFYRFLICPPIAQEVLQGIRSSSEYTRFEKNFLSFPMIGSPVHFKTYQHAVHLYRSARKVGLTIRSSTDCLIAAIAIENGKPIWHWDRDFNHLERISDLEVVHGNLEEWFK